MNDMVWSYNHKRNCSQTGRPERNERFAHFINTILCDNLDPMVVLAALQSLSRPLLDQLPQR